MYSASNLNPRGSSITSDFDQQPNFSLLMVTKKETVADGIFLFELRDPDGAELPAFTPGSHVTVEAPNGSRRNYSLCSDPAVTSHYQIAVKRDGSGRGGSISMADDVVQGQLLSVSAPRNNFELSERAKSFLFCSGWHRHYTHPVDDATSKKCGRQRFQALLFDTRREKHRFPQGTC